MGEFEFLKIRRDADLVNGVTGWRVVARRCQLDCAALGQWHDRLDQPFTKRLGAHDERAVMVLQRARNDFRCRRGAAVHNNHHRGTVENVTSNSVGPIANVNDAPTGTPLVVAAPLIRVEVPLMIGVSGLALVLGLDGTLGRVEGLLRGNHLNGLFGRLVRVAGFR